MELNNFKNTTVNNADSLKDMRDGLMSSLGGFGATVPVSINVVPVNNNNTTTPLEKQIALWYNANPQLLSSVFASAKLYFDQVYAHAGNNIFKIRQTIVDQNVMSLTLPDDPEKEVSFLLAYMFHMFPYYERVKTIEKSPLKHQRLINGVENVTIDALVDSFINSKVWNKQRGISHVDMVDVRMHW